MPGWIRASKTINMSRKILIAGNWKMNTGFDQARELCIDLIREFPKNTNTEVVVCPPFTHLSLVGETIKDSGILLGAQNVHQAENGAYTGEVSASMLRDAKVLYVIIGHSERREYFGENNSDIRLKIQRTMNAGLKVIFCVGEKLDERKSGRYMDIISGKINEVLNQDINPESLVIAYEPVWAIGTGETASPEQANEVHRHIRKLLGNIYGAGTADRIRILYGGSMKPGNASELLAQPDVDGGLIGGASLDAGAFVEIIKAG
jgi:triosephosphate isomerase (TIM)